MEGVQLAGGGRGLIGEEDGQLATDLEAQDLDDWFERGVTLL